MPNVGARAFLTPVFAALSLSVVLGACGGDNSQTEAATTTVAAEDVKVSDAEVTAGLNAMPALVDAAVAAAGTDAADGVYEEVHEKWESIEGTIRDKSSDLYISMEDELASLKTAVTGGDKAKAEQAKTKLAELTNQYLAQNA
jgi:hypothetical protein